MCLVLVDEREARVERGGYVGALELDEVLVCGCWSLVPESLLGFGLFIVECGGSFRLGGLGCSGVEVLPAGGCRGGAGGEAGSCAGATVRWDLAGGVPH